MKSRFEVGLEADRTAHPPLSILPIFHPSINYIEMSVEAPRVRMHLE